MGTLPNQPTASAKNETGEFERFTDFARRVMSVPHSAIKAELDAKKAARRPTKGRASRASGGPSKPA